MTHITQAQQLHGVFPALFTPLRDDDPKHLRNSIDLEKAAEMIEDLITAGVHGLVPVGTTGQSATLTPRQHLDFIRFVLGHVNGRVPVIAGAGSNCTRESVEMIQEIQKIAPVPVLCVTGYYNNPSQEGIAEHFLTLSKETGARIVIYNAPGRTANYIHPDTLIRLAEDPNIIGLKQAVDFRIGEKFHEDTERIIRETADKDFAVLSGEDGSFIDMLEMGGVGLVSATGNIPEAAKIFVDLFKAYHRGEYAFCDELQDAARDYVDAVFCRKNPIPLGAFFQSPLFLPLVSVRDTARGDEAEARIIKLIREKASSLLKYHPGLQ
ncbi:MAG TPA: 4-hydroxy-tetrahydrodipicolinate synthase [Fibrobacteraceae bacterium]|nr:4-hydroxy-tetrahydrodipicolinate synthase [Fibrobacteraceae bacterium]